jgi:hypothetical protein
VIISAAKGNLTHDRPPVFIVSATAPDVDVGATLIVASEAYKVLDVWPSDDVVQQWKQEVLSAVGVKDWATLERGAKLVHVERGDQAWTFTPMRKRRGGGWVRRTTDDDLPATRTTVVSRECSDGQLGAALKNALSGPTPTA